MPFQVQSIFKKATSLSAGLFYAGMSLSQNTAIANDNGAVFHSDKRPEQTSIVLNQGLEESLKSTSNIENFILGEEGGLLGPLLNRAGFSNSYLFSTMVPALLEAGLDPARLPRHQKVKFYRSYDGEFAYIEFPNAEHGLDSIVYDTQKSQAVKIDKAYDLKTHFLEGQITSSFYETLAGQNAPDKVIRDLIYLYSWDVNWARDLRKGDSISVLFSYPVRDEDSRPVTNQSDITYARLVRRGEPVELFAYETIDGNRDYYKADGTNIRGPLLRTPIDGARLSSGFNPRRLHPIYDIIRPHNGADFAAPVGTPIYAGGDGIVTYLDWKGPNGRLIRIQHAGGYMTGYAHLSGFKSDLEEGDRVKQGQVIGFVGQTGTATGPHLHYAIKYKERWVDPMKVEMPTGTKLEGRELENFKNWRNQVKEEVAQYTLSF